MASLFNRWTRWLVPTEIGKGVTRALGALVALVLLVGGISLAWALRIYHDNEAVALEYGHILELDEVHSVFDDLIFELQQMNAVGTSDRTVEAQVLHAEVVRRLDLCARPHAGAEDAAEAERERAALADLRRMSEELRALTASLAGRHGAEARLQPAELGRLHRASHDVPRLANELASLHRRRIAERIRDSQRAIGDMFWLYAAFIVVSVALVLLAGIVSRHAVTEPLSRLAEATRVIAQGRLDARVRVQSENEIGQLARAFNSMADGLQARERELQGARDQLEQRVRELQALYRIGTEISRLQHPERTLQSVAERAREFLRCDAATLCLCRPGSDELSARATSGPPEAFPPGPDHSCHLLPSAGDRSPLATACPAIAPQYRRGHLRSVLRLGDVQMGEIHVSTREPREFTTAEAELLDGLATQAAIAIERARLAEELRSLATVEERERLAREMHDGLAQALGLLHLKLQQAQALVADPSATAAALREMTLITGRTFEEVRQSIFGLRTNVSRGLGLVPTLTEYLHEFSAQNGIVVELEVTGASPLELPPASEVQAIRIIQEALANVRKHASARRSRVRLGRENGRVRIIVEDDGVGWDPADATNGERLHFGIQTMRERAEGLGGTLEIETTPGHGTRVVASLPGAAP